MSSDVSTQKVARWYFGGMAATCSACITHPLDLLKVQLQTQQEEKLSMSQLTRKMIRKHGVRALYRGVSASIVRQMTASTARFGIFELGKQFYGSSDVKSIDFWNRIVLAGAGGLVGGYIGTPADIITVRMQNDSKLPTNQQRKYKNVFDGLYRVFREEGPIKLFTGATLHVARSMFTTIGAFTMYDEVKSFLIQHEFHDNLGTHLISSVTAGAMATTISQPFDVVKTRAMNALPGQFNSIWAVLLHTAKLGPTGFYKGYCVTFFRLAPHTVLTFIFLEQLRLHFGIQPNSEIN